MASITTIETPLVLDLAINNGYHKVYGMQFDNNTRKLIIALENNGVPYVIPSGVTVKLQGHRPDGAAIFKDCDVINNQIHCILTSYELAVAGDCHLNITLYEGNPKVTEKFEGNRLSSFDFKVSVPKNPFSEDTIVASKEFSVLTETILKVEQALEDIKDLLDRAEDLVEDATDLTERNEKLNDELTDKLDEIDDKFKEIDDALDDVENAVNKANKASEKAEEAANKVNEVVSRIDDLEDRVDILEDKVDEIDDLSDKINNLDDLYDGLDSKFVKKSEVGKPNGVASLDNNGKVPLEQLPDGIGDEYEKLGFIGTMAELEQALAKGELEEGIKVFITDDNNSSSGSNGSSTGGNCNCTEKEIEVYDTVLLSTQWTGNTIPYIYDLGIEDKYDFEILISNTITAEEVEAMQIAQILANGNDNLLRAWGEKPTISIPVVVKKWEN